MIRHVYWAGMQERRIPSYVIDKGYDSRNEFQYIRDLRKFIGERYNPADILADFIKEGEDETICFITLNKQEKDFNKWIKYNKLEEYIIYQMPRPVTNHVHTNNGRNLLLTVIGSKKHVWREMYED